MSYLNRILEAIAMGHSLFFPCIPMFEDVQDMLSNIETNFKKTSPMWSIYLVEYGFTWNSVEFWFWVVLLEKFGSSDVGASCIPQTSETRML